MSSRGNHCFFLLIYNSQLSRGEKHCFHDKIIKLLCGNRLVKRKYESAICTMPILLRQKYFKFQIIHTVIHNDQISQAITSFILFKLSQYAFQCILRSCKHNKCPFYGGALYDMDLKEDCMQVIIFLCYRKSKYSYVSPMFS